MLISLQHFLLQIKIATLQPEPLRDEWFQLLSALIEAPEAAAITTNQDSASGKFYLFVFNYTTYISFIY